MFIPKSLDSWGSISIGRRDENKMMKPRQLPKLIFKLLQAETTRAFPTKKAGQ